MVFTCGKAITSRYLFDGDDHSITYGLLYIYSNILEGGYIFHSKGDKNHLGESSKRKIVRYVLDSKIF